MKNVERLKIKWKFIFLILLIQSSVVLAQSSILDNYIKKGLESSLTLQQEQLTINKSMVALQEAKGLFRPNVQFNASYTVALGGRSLDFPIGDMLNPIYSTLNQLTQTNQFPTDVENVSEQFLPHNFQETKVRVIYPLLNRDIYYNYKAKEAAISIQEAKKKVYEAELAKEIRIGYYRYLQAVEATKIYKETKVLLKEILRVNQKLVKYDKATKDVIYAAEYEITKMDNEIVQAEKNVALAQAYFNFLLNEPFDTPIEIDSTLPKTNDISPIYGNTLNQNDLIKNRSELLQLKGALETNEQLISLHEAAKYPKLNFVIDAGFQGYGYNLGTQGFGLAQLSFSWDIYDGKQRKKRLEQAQIQGEIYSSQYLEVQQQLRLQVKQASLEVDAARKNLEVNELALKSLQATYSLLDKKYRAGNGYYYELVEARTRLTNTKIAIVIAKYDLMIKIAELNRVIGE